MTNSVDGWIEYNADGEPCGYGTGPNDPPPGHTVVYSSDPFAESDVAAIETAISRLDDIETVEALKTETAYREKSIEAREILAGVAYDPLKHEFLEIEVRVKGITALEAAQAVVDAIRRDTLAKEDARVQLRESLWQA